MLSSLKLLRGCYPARVTSSVSCYWPSSRAEACSRHFENRNCRGMAITTVPRVGLGGRDSQGTGCRGRGVNQW